MAVRQSGLQHMFKLAVVSGCSKVVGTSERSGLGHHDEQQEGLMKE